MPKYIAERQTVGVGGRHGVPCFSKFVHSGSICSLPQEEKLKPGKNLHKRLKTKHTVWAPTLDGNLARKHVLFMYKIHDRNSKVRWGRGGDAKLKKP